ncbi:MAG: selenium metabolism-associated LysR family transcriptional regulator [Desulfitobacteriaceae bacterium]|nr:selenium metabolism-associated LysR family transcriptional regulator [Desulfitobacteriaceae bacterium]
MQISEFEIFLVVARAKSFSKAAKLLYMTQPAISNHIHAMENYYGTKLFNRHSHGVSLTSTGEVVYDFGEKILTLHDSMEKAIDRVLNIENQKLVVGASSNVGNYALPCSIWTFKEKYPEVDIRLEISNSATIIQQILDNKVDLGVLEGPVKHKDLVTTDIFSDRLILIAPPRGKWLKRETISLEELAKEPLIMREKGSGSRSIWEKIICAAGLELKDFRIVTEMGSIDAIKSAVESGLGVAVVSRISVQKELHRGSIRDIDISGIPSTVKFQVVFRAGNDQPGLATRFIRFISSPEERSFC